MRSGAEAGAPQLEVRAIMALGGRALVGRIAGDGLPAQMVTVVRGREIVGSPADIGLIIANQGR